MTLTYLFCLISGGVLIALSIAGDADGDLGGDPGGDGSGIAEGGNPAVLFSTSFWSFGLAGFGLCGLLLQLFQGAAQSPFTLPLALGLGVVMGWGAALALRVLARREANTVVRSDDLLGRDAMVTLPLSADQRGFVEVSVRGSLLRRAARSATRPMARGERAVILRAEGNTLIVEPLDIAEPSPATS